MLKEVRDILRPFVTTKARARRNDLILTHTVERNDSHD